jgi:hypothetical protein
MRPSSDRAVTLVLARFALAVSLAGGFAVGLGCNKEQPAPKKLERQSPFDRGGYEKRERKPDDPFRNPATETPAGRDGPQISEEEIDAALAEAAEAAAVENTALERIALRRCANKTPASARCDGRMGLSMIPFKNQRATALYFLSEAAVVDDPKADAALYRELGEELIRHARYDFAVSAMEKAVARDGSAEYVMAFGRLLSLVPERLDEAADRIAEARGLDDRIEWLYEEAVIRGQIPVREQAERSLALFQEYTTRGESAPSESLPVPPASIASRMLELERLTKIYPTAAEREKSQAAAAQPEPETQDPS